MKCPLCAAELQSTTHEGVEVDACPQLHGIWLDRSELQHIAAHEREPRGADERHRELDAAAASTFREMMSQIEREGRRSCPKCGEPMAKLDYDAARTIIVDSCPLHGVWLDRGELERIESYAEAVRERRAQHPEGPAPEVLAPGRTFLRGVALWEQMELASRARD